MVAWCLTWNNKKGLYSWKLPDILVRKDNHRRNHPQVISLLVELLTVHLFEIKNTQHPDLQNTAAQAEQEPRAIHSYHCIY